MVISSAPELAEVDNQGRPQPLTSPFERNSIENRSLLLGDKMTLIVAMKADGAIIVASDSRALVGNQFTDTSEKIFPQGNYLVGVAGLGEAGKGMLQIYGPEIEKNSSSLNSFVLNISIRFATDYNGRFGKADDKAPLISFVVAGYSEGKQVIFSLRSNLGFLPELGGEFPVLSGNIQTAMYLCRKFQPPISREAAIILSKRLIKETASSDLTVGGPIHIWEILPTGYPVDISNAEITKQTSPIIPEHLSNPKRDL